MRGVSLGRASERGQPIRMIRRRGAGQKIPTVLRSVGNCGGLLRGRALISAMFRGR